jgi:hypothetical protein
MFTKKLRTSQVRDELASRSSSPITGQSSIPKDLTLDSRVLLLEKMSELSLPIPQNEVFKIFHQVRFREFPEGISLTNSFREALFSFLTVHPGYCETSFSPLWDPDGQGVDVFSMEDVKAIERIKENKWKDETEL